MMHQTIYYYDRNDSWQLHNPCVLKHSVFVIAFPSNSTFNWDFLISWKRWGHDLWQNLHGLHNMVKGPLIFVRGGWLQRWRHEKQIRKTKMSMVCIDCGVDEEEQDEP